MEKWKAEGGLEQLKAAKKEAKKEARLAKSGGSPKKKAKAAGAAPSGSKAPTFEGAGFKSKEFVEDSDSGKGELSQILLFEPCKLELSSVIKELSSNLTEILLIGNEL